MFIITVWDPILFTFAVYNFIIIAESLYSKCKQYGIPYCGTEHVTSMYWNVCLMMVTCNRNMKQLYIIEYIVVFWLNDILVKTQYIGNAKKICYYDTPPMKIPCIFTVHFILTTEIFFTLNQIWCDPIATYLSDPALCQTHYDYTLLFLNVHRIRHKCVTFKMHKQITL
jgi:hypothetical protein